MYGVRYQVWGRNDRLQNKERLFDTEAKRNKFVEKVETKDNFHQFTAWLDEEDGN